MEETIVTPVEIQVANKRGPKPKVKKEIIIKNVSGEDVSAEDYFFNGKAPEYFNDICGLPVEREDLIETFNKIFSVKDNFLFYKTKDKEVYLVIIPLKNSTTIGAFNDSVDGDFQKHAISFISEGSVNLDTLKMKLRRILPFVQIGDRQIA